MDPRRLTQLLEGVRDGNVAVEDAQEALARLPGEDLGFAMLDHHRALRNGHGEVIFGEGKTAEEVVAIASRLIAAGTNVLATRLDSTKADALRACFPDCTYHPRSRLATITPTPVERLGKGTIAVVSAGTSDGPVAEEAEQTARFLGNDVLRIDDVGVAGIHRLLARLDELRQARVLVVVAGMEGALPTVVAGVVQRPVIAVPTSVGYGAAFNGVAALLGMLTSCASGVTVVNIDNGFGAAYAASLINRL